MGSYDRYKNTETLICNRFAQAFQYSSPDDEYSLEANSGVRAEYTEILSWGRGGRKSILDLHSLICFLSAIAIVCNAR